MTTTATPASQPPKNCQFCDRKGLPILPLRYAVARKDKGNAPPLSAPFEIGSKEKDKAALALPAAQAHYTMRLLRPGYLYVYDEHRKEWSAYQVAPGGYLFQFDPHAKAPPGGFGQASFACKRAGDAMIARCITVKDAAKATKIWLGYSDVAWTPAVLAKHDHTAYREAHMRSIDVAAVRGNGKQPHAAGFAELGQRVAEYATTPTALNAETTAYVARFLPSPYKKPSALLDASSNAKTALRMCSKLIVNLLPHAMAGQASPHGRTPSAAWAFSTADIEADGNDVAAMQAWAATAAKPFHGGMVALDDPAGVAMEINGLALQLSAEFAEEPQRKWKHETALTIAALKEAVMHGAVEREASWRKFWADGFDRMGESGPGYGVPASSQQVDAAEAAVAADNARIDKEVEEQADVIGEAKWKSDYASLFNEAAQQDELSPTGGYAKALQQFAEQHIKPLDAAFLGWLKSASLVAYFTHNFDAKDIDSGLSYTQVLTVLLNQSGGRMAVVNYLAKAVQQNPTDPSALIARGFALNQDALARKWVEAAAEKAAESEAGKALAEISEKVYDGYKGLLLAGNSGAAFNSVAKYTYQLSASLVNALGDEVTNAAATVGRSLPTRMIYGLLGAVAREEDPNVIMVNLRTSASSRQAAKIVSRALATVLGGGGNQYASAAQKVLDAHPRSFQGVVLIDKAKAETLLAAKGGRTLSGTQIAGVVEAQAFEEAVHDTAGKLANGEVKGGVIGAILMAITCKFAYHEYASAEGSDRTRKAVNFFAGAIPALVGGSFEIAGSLVEKTAFGAAKLTAPFQVISVRFGSAAEWLTGAGKMLGAVGGVVAGVMIIGDGMNERSEGHLLLGATHILLGGLSIIAAFLLLTTWAAAGFIVGLVVGLILLVIAIFKHNKVQNWLENAKFFGDGGLKQFENAVEQMQAMAALGKE